MECKSGERALSPAITYFKDRLGIPKVYQVHRGTKNYGNASTTGQVLPFIEFCKLEGL
ncbi:MAG: hypothetical protein NDJ90_15330 [Oligoflexia bacterium]|nr:hypothetical protein [Oligoflexia bacterium]